jgi:hypothetical protein
MDYNVDLKDKDVALIIWNTEKEDDVHVYLGKIILEEDTFYFINEHRKWKVSLNSEQLERLKLVPEDLKQILLQANYSLSVTIADLPDDNSDGLIYTGINWDK